MLIVAGPSGAGKTAFLTELAAGRLQDDIQQLLPEGASTWREVWNNRREHWEPLLARDHLDAKVAGHCRHYDITLQWLQLNGNLDRDPFWEVLKRSEAVTLVNIRPSRRRLLRQWMHHHLGVRSLWMAHSKKAVAICASHLLSRLRRLRTKFVRRKQQWRYPHRIRFLEHVDRALESRLLSHELPSFDFYCVRRNVETMLDSWDAVTAAKLAAMRVTRIELTPDDRSEVAKAFRWQIVAAQAAAQS
ncbi:MAG: hypothetical protein HC861_02695 [Rhodospirillaceae bacterium]|nr:hypothetical protein [Rhodospirillaceae bacterium]